MCCTLFITIRLIFHQCSYWNYNLGCYKKSPNFVKQCHHVLVFFLILVWPYCRTRSECWEGDRLETRRETDGIFLESVERLNSSVGRGRCCSEDEFSVEEGRRHGQSALCWAREEVIEGWRGELSGQHRGDCVKDSVLDLVIPAADLCELQCLMYSYIEVGDLVP